MGYTLPQPSAQPAVRALHAWATGFPTEFIQLSELLELDALEAAKSGDAPRVVANIQAQLAMAAHLQELPLLLHKMFASMVHIHAFGVLGNILHRHPDLLEAGQLRELASQLDAVQLTLVPFIEGERLFLDDVIQRIFTDDGGGRGHWVRPGNAIFGPQTPVSDSRPLKQRLFERVLETAIARPVISLALPSREEFTRATHEFFDAVAASANEPAAEALQSREEAMQMRFPYEFFGIHWRWPHGVVSVLAATENERQALALALRLVRYRHEFGHWPGETELLVPRFIPAIPIDRQTAREIRHRLDEEGQPVVFRAGDHSAGEQVLWPFELIR